MNAVVKTLILGGAVVGGAIFALDAHNDQVSRLDLEAQRYRLRAAYVERTSFAYSLPSTDRYRDEFSSASKWYEAELADLYNHHPGKHDPDAALHELEEQQKSGKLKAEAFASRKEFYDLAKGFYTLVQTGKYNPLYSAPMYGVRVDLLSIRRETYEGKSRLRVDAAVWGAPRRESITRSDNGKSATSKMMLDFAFKKLSLEFVDDKHKLVGGGDTGAPTFLVDHPERWVPDFPPQAALAVWYIDPMPREAASATFRLEAEIRSPSGGPIPMTISTTVMPQEDWKLRDGEKFEGEERVMPVEEMERGAGK